MANPVDIIRRSTVVLHPAPGVEKKVVAVFYRIGPYPERVLYIPESEYNEDVEKERVKEAAFGK